MLFLIDKGSQIDFNTALKEFGVNISIDSISLFKPVYVRYTIASKNKQSLMKIKDSIDKGVSAKKLVLYDVPVILKNSKLHLIGTLWLDLWEEEMVKNQWCKYGCVSLGKIKKFDKVEINLNYNKMGKIVLKGKGYYWF